MEPSSERPGAEEPSRAEALFLEHLSRVEAGEESDFEGLCAAHPGLADELRELKEGEAWAREMGLAGRTGTHTAGAAGAAWPERPDPLIGTLFHDKYRIVRRIGQGGFGTVYEAVDERGAGNPVAIKVLSGAAAASAVHQQSFRDEARRVTRLSHPNIVDWKVFDETDEGLSYFVMELVQGEKFDQVLAREGRITPDRAARLLLQVLDALRAAHHLSHGESLLHLDLKPDNLFLIPAQGGREEQVKVIDFGIGQYIGDQEVVDTRVRLPAPGDSDTSGPSTLTFCSVGARGSTHSSRVQRSRGCTPEYASPEQVEHVLDRDEILPLDGRSDLYSLGVVAYQMLTGRLPFVARESRLDVLRMHLEEPVPRLAASGVRIPRKLARFVERCLEKDRELRWSDTNAAHAYLRDFVHPPTWRTVALVAIPLLIGALALGSWLVATREVPIPVAGLLTEEGLELGVLALGPARPFAVLRLAMGERSPPSQAGAWEVVSASTGERLAGWRAAWEGDELVALSGPAEHAGRAEERLRLELGSDRLHTQPFTAVWIGADAWSVPAVEIADRSVEELAGLGVAPDGVALDVWIAGEARGEIDRVRVDAGGGQTLDLARVTGTAERERYRLALDDARLADGPAVLSLRVVDAAGGEWRSEFPLEVVRTPLAFADVELVDSAGTPSDDGVLPRCNRTAGRYVVSPRTRPRLQLRLSRAADVSWALFTEASDQPVLRGSSSGRQRSEFALDEIPALLDGLPFEGRIRLVAREDAYVLHGRGSLRGVAEVELAFRYEDTEPRFAAQWVDARGTRDISVADALFTRDVRAELLITREENVPMRIEAEWWPEDRSAAPRRAASTDLRNVQVQQTRLPVELDEDGPYTLRVSSWRYDSSVGETGDTPDREASFRLVLDRTAPTLVLTGIESGAVLGAGRGVPEVLDLRLGSPTAGEQPPVELHWVLRCLSGRSWSASGTLPSAPGSSAQLPLARIWDENGAPDGRFRLELSGMDAAGNALVPETLAFEVSAAGPLVTLEEPGALGHWYPDATTGLWHVRLRLSDPNGLGDPTTCVLRVPEDDDALPIELATEAGHDGEERLLGAAFSLPHTLSEATVRLEVAARDRHGARSSWTSAPLELPSIAPPRPERIAVRIAGRRLGPMRLVRGNAGYTYVFGGRGDGIENTAFLRAELPPFNDSPRHSRPRSWQVEIGPGEIDDYYLDEREVRVGEFLPFLEDPDGYPARRHWAVGTPDEGRRNTLRAWISAHPDDAPVAEVTLEEAAAYARWAGKRLPSWVEWEFAARDGGNYRVRPGEGPIADLGSSLREWTATPTPFGSERDRRNPHLWAREHTNILLRRSVLPDPPEYWIAGAATTDERSDFSVVDCRPRTFHDALTGFRCAASLQDVQTHLGVPTSEDRVFEEVP